MSDTKMNPEIKAQWTAALRGGEYRQDKNYLRTEDGYCCLGVLCELAVKAGAIEPGHWDDRGDYFYGEESLILPVRAQGWAWTMPSLHAANPVVDIGNLPKGVILPDDYEAGEALNLAQLNDAGTPFAVIADIIDQQL